METLFYLWVLFGLPLLILIGLFFIIPKIMSKRRRRKEIEEQQRLRYEISMRYRVSDLPESIRINSEKKEFSQNIFVLNYPSWLYSKQDGCRDARRSGNRILWNNSIIIIGNYTLVSKYPFDIVKAVQKFRLAGNTIDLCDEEKIKYQDLLRRRNRAIELNSALSIYERFQNDPVQFEYFCARLFESQGYRCQVTPATNDGGYDIAFSKGLEKGIIECKCFKPGNNVSRPAVQKLVGANMNDADRLIFITTSGFTGAAMEYAAQKNVELIDGKKLFTMISHNSHLDSRKISPSEYHLQVSDLKRYVPADIYDAYFY